MSVLVALVAVGLLACLGALGAAAHGLNILFGIVLPYAAAAVFAIGFVYRVLKWAKSPVPFRIPTTCGQQKSLPWIRNAYWDNPHTLPGVLGRMFLEVFTFRTLFRNTKAGLVHETGLRYDSSKWLWASALAFHGAFLAIIIRHWRFFTQPVPAFIQYLSNVDGFFQIGLPILYATDGVIVAGLGFLLLRRIASSQLRYISLPADYFPVFLILGIALTGMAMRYLPAFRVDIIGVKNVAMGWITLRPVAANLGLMFYVHVTLVSALLAYFPFSKLMHMPGVFLSPTRNLANNNRARRHVNPWNPPLKGHTFAEWQEEFKDKLEQAGLPYDEEAGKA